MRRWWCSPLWTARSIAASGTHLPGGAPFPIAALQETAGSADNAASMMVNQGRIYQMVTVAVRSPLPVAWIAMGFEFDSKAARELADITGLAVTLSAYSDGRWQNIISTVPAGSTKTSDVATRRIELARTGTTQIVAVLSRSLADARAPFERLTKVLYVIAAVSLVAFALAAFWLARNITRPLQDLTRVVDRMRAGTYDAQRNVERGDELGVLAEGLHLMQTAVQTRDQSIRRLAYQDALTGLMNRTAFGSALSEALRGGALIGVAVINLHRFRRINEHLGYSVGDAVLREIAARIAAVPSRGRRGRTAGRGPVCRVHPARRPGRPARLGHLAAAGTGRAGVRGSPANRHQRDLGIGGIRRRRRVRE